MKLADISKGIVIGGRFRLVDILGSGSYGTVWLADVIGNDSSDLPSQIALKIFAHQDSGNRLLFREAQNSIGFAHERLVRVYGAQRLDGLAMMWMEYVPGHTLHQILGDDDNPKPVSLKQVLTWLRDIAEGLAYMHMQEPPFVHGDLKLDNVLVDPDFGARLADFGQSRPIEDRFIETDGVGAWPYLAPEVLGRSIDGRGKRGVPSDVYAFGVIAYRFLTGRFPRRTMTEAINMTPFPRAGHLNSSIPPDLDVIVAKCLEKRSKDRYATGSDVLAAIEKLLGQLEKNGQETYEVPEPERIDVPTATDELAKLARELLSQGQVEQVILRLEKAMQRMSTSPQVLLVYGEAAKRVGKYDAALTVFHRALRWIEQHGRPDEEKRDAVEGLAEVNVRLKRYEVAVPHFQFLAERWPERRWYRYRYGVALGLEGSTSRLRKSIEVLQGVFDEESSAVVAAKIGHAYEELGQTDQACQYYNEALMIDEYEPTALFQLGRIRAIQQRTEKANECLERLLQVEGAEDQARSLARLMGRESVDDAKAN
jgi:eukaryotic-like serine/threonine-protein kinase